MLKGICAFAMQDKEVMLRLIPKKIVLGEFLGNERGPSRGLSWV